MFTLPTFTLQKNPVLARSDAQSLYEHWGNETLSYLEHIHPAFIQHLNGSRMRTA
jgi:hypothetical protein